MDFDHIALVGLGLIASSIALNIKSKKNRIKITGYSRTKKTREEYRKINFCTVCDNYEDCIKEANLVILCVPVGAMGDTMEKIAPYLSKSAIVTDVGSVKESVILEVQKKLPKGVFFVPAHPLAGTENSGPSAGFASLFENRWCILTPSKNVPIEIIKKVNKTWVSINEQNVGIISSFYEFVKDELYELQEKTKCQDTFILLLMKVSYL